MTLCEMCGKESLLLKTKIEGTELMVCGSCASFGKVLQKPAEIKESRPKPKKFVENKIEEVIEIISGDYSKRIRDARNWMGLTQKEFAKKLSEKESLIQKMESNHLMPTLDLAKKIEKTCNIKLIENYKEKKESAKINFKDKSLTIGDLIDLKDEE